MMIATTVMNSKIDAASIVAAKNSAVNTIDMISLSVGMISLSFRVVGCSFTIIGVNMKWKKLEAE